MERKMSEALFLTEDDSESTSSSFGEGDFYVGESKYRQ